MLGAGEWCLWFPRRSSSIPKYPSRFLALETFADVDDSWGDLWCSSEDLRAFASVVVLARLFPLSE